MPSSPLPETQGPGGALPGFIASQRSTHALSAILDARHGTITTHCGSTELTSWGLPTPITSTPTLSLSRVARTALREVSDIEIAELMRDDPARLTALLPPFAAVRGAETGVAMVADSMGFRQLYHSAPHASGPPVLSTSAVFAAWARDAEPDQTAVAVQSLLGWQLGQRTLFEGVNKLAPGATAYLDAGRVRVIKGQSAPEPPLTLEEAVRLAATLLRSSLNALLDDYPDAVLQLTGGQDSRLLLSAIPLARRRGLRAMTLDVPGSEDVRVARQLAERFELKHEVHGLAALDGLSSTEAWGLARDAAMRLDGMSDPIALAALGAAESGFDQGVRISGLGGEVARGFYYAGVAHERPFTVRDVERLAAWRMFVNEAVEQNLLDPDFSAWARAAAFAEVATAMEAAGDEWFHATDELYLRHRMQRWAGVTDTAVGYRRVVINPMLCQQFLSIASRLPPAAKANSLFLARLQMELDPELGNVPLEGRPAPAAAAHPHRWSATTAFIGSGRRLGKKAVQRLLRQNRAPAGGFILSSKVVEHWQKHPQMLSSAALSHFIRPQWIEGVLRGTITPRPSSVAFLTNMIVINDKSMRTTEH